MVRPAIAVGARAAGRDPAAVELIAPVLIVSGASEAERAAAESHARQQIAFYASTPSYRPFLAYHGCEALGKELSGLAREGRFAEMAARVPDALLDAVAVNAAPAAWARRSARATRATSCSASTPMRRSRRTTPTAASRRWSPGSERPEIGTIRQSSGRQPARKCAYRCRKIDLTQAERNAMKRELAGLVEDYRRGAMRHVRRR